MNLISSEVVKKKVSWRQVFCVEKDEHWWLVTPEGTPYPDLEAVLIRRILDIY